MYLSNKCLQGLFRGSTEIRVPDGECFNQVPFRLFLLFLPREPGPCLDFLIESGCFSPLVALANAIPSLVLE